jgi:polyisoprenoid-binding protein YceI
MLAFVLWATAAISAQQTQVTLDPAQTRIEWTLNATAHTVHGTFKLKSGTIFFDPASGNASGEIVVDTASGDSGNRSRDNNMHKEVLETKRYPEITFLPRKVLGNLAERGNSNIQVQGVFRIHGAGHDITLPVLAERDGSLLRLTTSFAVPYRDWGMKNPSNMFLHVENDVAVKVTSVGQLANAPAH